MTAPVRLRARRVQARTLRLARRVLRLEKTVYVDQRVAEYRAHWEEGARCLGASLVDLSAGVWEVRLGGRHTRIANNLVQADDPVILEIAGDKALCSRLAHSLGVPVPPEVVCTLETADAAHAFLARSGAPLVVKPAQGASSGMGITTAVQDHAALENALALASLFSRDIVVQQTVPGESYRLLFLGGELIHAVRRRGTYVTGNGAATVRQLLAGAGPSIAADPTVPLTLAAQGLGLESVPPAGRSVLVRGLPAGEGRTRELRTEYDEPALGLVSPLVVAEVQPMVRAIESELAGIDLITVDPSRSLRDAGGAFIEINTTPGLHHHYVPGDDPAAEPVAARVLRYLLSR